MAPDDAEEYTQALGQVVAGGWRQIALGERLGVPAALGMSTREWVEGRLGGYIRLSIPERREAVKELTDEGMSTRQVGDVLGVGVGTVHRDRVPDGTPEPEPKSERQVELPVEPSVVPDGTPEPEPPPTTARTEAAWLLVQNADFWARVSKAPQTLDPDAIVPLMDDEERTRALSSLTNHRRWLDRYEQALRATNLRVVK
jgi:hypothetical protein